MTMSGRRKRTRHGAVRRPGSILDRHIGLALHAPDAAGWAARRRALSRSAEEIYVCFTNDAQGFAVTNALELTARLGDAAARPRVAPDVPSSRH
jgi:hypothetical protein